jgi:hypothetical protein
MTTPLKPSPIVPIALAVLLLALAGYVATYYSISTPIAGSGAIYFPIGSNAPLDQIQWRQTWCERIFAPMEWLDHRLRPRVWEPK